MLFFPKMYQKDVFHIDYEKLYKKGIRCLFFDLDNTLGRLDQSVADDALIALFQKLSKKFQIAIISNHTSKKRVGDFAKSLRCEFFHFALKPSRRCLRKAQKKFRCKKEEICMIGDQLITDILVANRFGIYSCLVDALAEKDLKITSLNRLIEKFILKRYHSKNRMKKGEYYG